MTILTKADARRAIRNAETVAVLLVQPGFVSLGIGQRREIATTLRELAELGRRAFDPFARTDFGTVPAELRDDDDDDEATVMDLFGGAA